MLSKRQEKLIRSLQSKKFRKEHQLFCVEGLKLLHEAIESKIDIEQILITEQAKESLGEIDREYERLEEEQMKSLSSLSTAPGVMAVIKIPDEKDIEVDLALYLDGISDPGNMGTIIRTAEGLGVQKIILSPDCVDLFSPKVVQASMGSIFRMNYTIRNRKSLSDELRKGRKLYTADMDGSEIYVADLQTPAILIMGSESHGVSDELLQLENSKLSIPISSKLESYNVAISTAMILSEFKRRSLI